LIEYRNQLFKNDGGLVRHKLNGRLDADNGPVRK